MCDVTCVTSRVWRGLHLESAACLLQNYTGVGRSVAHPDLDLPSTRLGAPCRGGHALLSLADVSCRASDLRAWLESQRGGWHEHPPLCHRAAPPHRSLAASRLNELTAYLVLVVYAIPAAAVQAQRYDGRTTIFSPEGNDLAFALSPT